MTDFGSSTVREITLAGHVTTIAGTAGVTGSANNTGTNALFNHPIGIVADSSGNLYVADYGNDLIRKITTGRVVSTWAGQAGVAGSGNGTGTGAQFDEPEGVAIDASGNVYVADTGNATIRMITTGQAVSTPAGLAGSVGGRDGTGTNAYFYQPVGIVYAGGGNLYVSDAFYDTIRQVSTAGAVLTVAGVAQTAGSTNGAGSQALFSAPHGLAYGSSAGTLYIADSGNGMVREMSASDIVTTLAGTPSAGSAAGMSTSARFYAPQGIAADSANNVYVADTQNSVIREISPAGVVSVLAGTVGSPGFTNGSAATAQFSSPQAVAVDGNGNVYVADTGNDVIRKISSGTCSTLAGSANNPGYADATGTAVQFNQPTGVAVDGNGNVYVADTMNFVIRKITSGGVSSTLAGLAGAARHARRHGQRRAVQLPGRPGCGRQRKSIRDGLQQRHHPRSQPGGSGHDNRGVAGHLGQHRRHRQRRALLPTHWHHDRWLGQFVRRRFRQRRDPQTDGFGNQLDVHHSGWNGWRYRHQERFRRSGAI